MTIDILVGILSDVFPQGPTFGQSFENRIKCRIVFDTVQNLKTYLNKIYQDYHRIEFLHTDPLEFVHRYSDPFDQEAVALLSAVLAYGNVKQIRRSIEGALLRMNPSQGPSKGPAHFVRSLTAPRPQGSRNAIKRALLLFQDYVHRFNCGADIVLLLWLLNQSWSQHGSLGHDLMKLSQPEDPDIGPALSALIKKWRELSKLASIPSSESFSYLLTSPADGSCCKRWCMFLRWMGRRDDLDPGLWSPGGKLEFTFREASTLKAHQLIMPLDTHTGRISQKLGLTRRKSLNWKAAQEVTQTLKKIAPEDPTRYDFALCRAGILKSENRGRPS